MLVHLKKNISKGDIKSTDCSLRLCTGIVLTLEGLLSNHHSIFPARRYIVIVTLSLSLDTLITLLRSPRGTSRLRLFTRGAPRARIQRPIYAERLSLSDSDARMKRGARAASGNDRPRTGETRVPASRCTWVALISPKRQHRAPSTNLRAFRHRRIRREATKGGGFTQRGWDSPLPPTKALKTSATRGSEESSLCFSVSLRQV